MVVTQCYPFMDVIFPILENIKSLEWPPPHRSVYRNGPAWAGSGSVSQTWGEVAFDWTQGKWGGRSLGMVEVSGGHGVSTGPPGAGSWVGVTLGHAAPGSMEVFTVEKVCKLL
ncbi:unnamed protein product [Boreogadus saida]